MTSDVLGREKIPGCNRSTFFLAEQLAFFYQTTADMQTQVVYCFEKIWKNYKIHKKVIFNIIIINDKNEHFFYHIIEFISRSVLESC